MEGRCWAQGIPESLPIVDKVRQDPDRRVNFETLHGTGYRLLRLVVSVIRLAVSSLELQVRNACSYSGRGRRCGHLVGVILGVRARADIHHQLRWIQLSNAFSVNCGIAATCEKTHLANAHHKVVRLLLYGLACMAFRSPCDRIGSQLAGQWLLNAPSLGVDERGSMREGGTGGKQAFLAGGYTISTTTKQVRVRATVPVSHDTE